MPMDDYDMTIVSYDDVLNVYKNDDVVDEFMGRIQSTDNTLQKEILNTIKRLRYALSVLDTRTITNIGGKVAHYIIPENYINNVSIVRPRWYLIQVWRC
jgi:hypothetical protein